MTGPYARLKRLADDCTVAIPAAGVVGGSGFFVGPGLVITCAHVVAARDGAAASTALVEWRGEQRSGQVHAVPPKAGPDDLWAFPDLCLIELTPPPGQPWVVLGELDAGDTRVYLGGFNNVYDRRTPRLQRKSARIDEPQDLAGGSVWQLADCELAPGMSGGPVLDLASGTVCAVVKTQRKPGTTMGGLAIPAQAIRDAFPDVWRGNGEASADTRLWRNLRDAVRNIADPLDARLNQAERQELIGAASQLGLRLPDFNGLWEQLAPPFAARPGASFESVIDLARALADLPEAEPDPLIRLFERIGDMRKAASLDPLQQRAAEIAMRSGQSEALDKMRAATASTPSAGPVIVVRLERYGPQQRKYLITMWSCPARDGRHAKQVECDPGPHTEPSLRRVLADALAEEIRNLPPGTPLIEFVLPDHLLDRRIEEWQLNGWQLGVDYPVVVRFDGREPLEEHAWRSRGHLLHELRLPARHVGQWADLWIDCQAPRDLNQLDGKLQRNRDMPFVALTAWPHGKPLPPGVIAARHAGALAIVWQHEPCPEHRKPPPEPDDESCRGSRFRTAVHDYLADVELGQLPERIWQLRAEAAGRTDDPGSPGRHIAILWDDPARVPWGVAPASQPPVTSQRTELP